jgi:hypothetical protein
VRPKWFLSLCCIMYKPCTYLAPKQHCLQTDRSKISYDTRHLGVPSCAARLISKHLVCSMQTVHLSWIKISSISKQTKPSIHLSPFTLEYQQVHTKWFLRLWFIRCKLCTYLTPKLTMSPNGPKRDPYDTCHQGVPSSAFKLISNVPCKPCTYLAYGLVLSPN